MAQSTEDYLDSLLRQAMGIPDPEPEIKPEPDTSMLQREDVLAMADGLTGSNSAILGNAYDHNASFTNAGEINTAVPVSNVEVVEETAVPAQMPATEEIIADIDAPVAIQTEPVQAEPALTEPILPEISEPEETAIPETGLGIDLEAEPDISNLINALPDAPVIEHDESNLDIIHEPSIQNSEFNLEEAQVPVVEEPVIEEESIIA